MIQPFCLLSARPFKIIKDFEDAVGEYTGAPYVVAVNSCTNALFLCLQWERAQRAGGNERVIEIPKYTYISVPMQIKHSGFNVKFTDEDWQGIYQLKPFFIFDAARRFTSYMYLPNTFMCTSHHWSKILGIQHGGCILHDDKEADAWLRRARFDGRTDGLEAGKDMFTMLGYHMPMPPEVAAAGLVRLSQLPKHNKDLPRSNYPDLSLMEIFK